MTIFSKRIESLLEEKIGLSVKAVGDARVRHAISQRMANTGLDQDAYFGFLSGSSQEWEELVELVVIPETWFFRNRESFRFLQRYAMTEWLPKNSEQILRILSIPCATGEEAYSIAMTLADAGFPTDRFHIDGADISGRSLRKAAQGKYGRESFREKESIREPDQDMGQKIRWLKGNLPEPGFLADELPYHVIFCRNLIMYFNDSARRRAIEALMRLLASDGLLFVGHAEVPIFSIPDMVRIHHPGVFAFRKTPVSHRNPQPVSAKKAVRSDIEPKRIQASPPIAAKMPEFRSASVQERKPEKKEENLLIRATKLADMGDLDKAAALCETYLSDHPTDAEAHFLMGLMRKALADETAAEQWFDKALYLDPRHREALHHLSLIREKQGDASGAAHLRERARRSE